MEVIDPGHYYLLDTLDDPGRDSFVSLTFVKREGEGYPGNKGSYPGTNIQEVLRALIDRVKYLDKQISDNLNNTTLYHLRSALFSLEKRAAIRHKRSLSLAVDSSVHGTVNARGIEDFPVCSKCGHIECEGKCH